MRGKEQSVKAYLALKSHTYYYAEEKLIYGHARVHKVEIQMCITVASNESLNGKNIILRDWIERTDPGQMKAIRFLKIQEE